MDWNVFGLVLAVLALAGGAAAYWAGRWWERRNHQDGPGGDGEDPDILEMVLSLQRRQKRLEGRFNAFAPPRLGTGAGDGDDSRPSPDRVAPAPDLETRADILRRFHKGRVTR